MTWPLSLEGGEMPTGARPLTELSILILVGLTGVGKSTLLEKLEYPLLPDRRALVDTCVFPALGLEPSPDRVARFEATRRYRALNPGGLAQALAQAWTLPAPTLLFDGLRGEAEVGYAWDHMPEARFIFLEADDLTRLKRLIGRRDPFDQVGGGVGDAREEEIRSLAAGLFSDAELEQVLRWAVPADDLLAKLKVVVSERRNYAPAGSLERFSDPRRALRIDTVASSPDEAADQVHRFVEVRQKKSPAAYPATGPGVPVCVRTCDV